MAKKAKRPSGATSPPTTGVEIIETGIYRREVVSHPPNPWSELKKVMLRHKEQAARVVKGEAITDIIDHCERNARELLAHDAAGTWQPDFGHRAETIRDCNQMLGDVLEIRDYLAEDKLQIVAALMFNLGRLSHKLFVVRPVEPLVKGGKQSRDAKLKGAATNRQKAATERARLRGLIIALTRGGMTTSKAIAKVAREQEVSVRHLWECHKEGTAQPKTGARRTAQPKR